jgi:hypothetical protein
VFVSYSSLDRLVVRKIAHLLTKGGVRVWWADWEMRPGDRLRDRINAGIQSADYFLVIVSPSSVDSRWVQNELDAAMIQEIEDHRVTVIPAILGKTEFKDLPADLRGKYALDFRSAKQRKVSIERLVDVIRPERRDRRELLKRLRRPNVTDPVAVAELRQHALRYGDQSIQIAALRGLERIGTTEAMLVVVERALNPWGTQALEATTSSLLRLHGVGGGLGLTAILLADYRFFAQRLAAIAALLGPSDSEIAARLRSLDFKSSFDLRDLVPGKVSLLERASVKDVSCGAVLTRHYAGEWARGIQPASNESISKAFSYAEKRVPGLLAILGKPRDPALEYLATQV